MTRGHKCRAIAQGILNPDASLLQVEEPFRDLVKQMIQVDPGTTHLSHSLLLTEGRCESGVNWPAFQNDHEDLDDQAHLRASLDAAGTHPATGDTSGWMTGGAHLLLEFQGTLTHACRGI